MFVKIISFDVGGTLVDYSYFDFVWNEIIPQLYSEKYGLAIREAKDYVLKEYDVIGTSDIRWYVPEYWFERFKLEEDPIEVFRSHKDKIRVYPEVPSVVERLSHQYILVTASGIPTNIQEIVMERFKRYFSRFFSPISDLQDAKKTTAFYGKICNILATEPSSILHVGDNYKFDFEAPKEIGIRSVLLDRKGEKKESYFIHNLQELEERLKESNSRRRQIGT